MAAEEAPAQRLCTNCEELHLYFSELFEKSLGRPRGRRIGTVKQIKANERDCDFCHFLVEAYELAFNLKPGQLAPGATGKERISLRIDQRHDPGTQHGAKPHRKAEVVEDPWYELAGITGKLPPASALWLQFSASSTVVEPLILISCTPREPIEEAVLTKHRYAMPRERSSFLANQGSIDYSLVHAWISVCEERHADTCGRPTTYQQQTLNLKLIDVLTREIKTVVKYEPYVALSYVWGPDGREKYASLFPLMTEAQDRSPVLLPRSIPQTIEDAMLFTGFLKIRYLWVDIFCINQTDEEEKQAQIDKMHLVYECAFLTIVALDGDNINSGLAGISRAMTQTRQPHVETKYGIFMATYIHSMWDHQGNAPWDLRAWTLQELVLSRRAILFDRNHLFFACTEEAFHEAMHLDTEFDRIETGLSQKFLWENGFGLSLDMGRWDFIQFDILLANYTRRALTDDSDILSACTGVLNQITRYTGVGFLYGMPLSHLHRALLWKAHHYATLVRRTGFPSWSWTGWKGRIEYHYCFSELDNYPISDADGKRHSTLVGGTGRDTPQETNVKRNPSAFITTPKIRNVEKPEILQVSSSVARFKLKKVRSKGQAVNHLREGSEQMPFAVGDQWALLDHNENYLKNLVGGVAHFEEADYAFQVDQATSLLIAEAAECEVLFIKHFDWLRDSDIHNNWLDDLVGVLVIHRVSDDSALRIGSLLIRLEDWVNANPHLAVVNLV